MGALPKQQQQDEDAPEGPPPLDVSAEGTLVWLRRPNGSWWPSIVISPQDVPDGCPAPPRCPATPIMLLGRRRDGPTFVEWCNLESCKRVKPFRCGELDFDHRITNAQALAAAANRTTRPYSKGRYARMEDAILHALHIEQTARPAPAPHSPLLLPARKKRKTPYDSEDDAPNGSRRMRDLSDIASNPAVLSNASAPKHHHHHTHAHAAAKRKHQPSGTPRKKDRSRPISELCNGDTGNGSRSNGHHFMPLSTCSSSSSATSSLDTSLDRTTRHLSAAFATHQPKPTQASCITGLLSDDFHFPRPRDSVQATTPEADHLQAYQPRASTKNPTWKASNQATDYCKADKSPQCDRKKCKMKSISSVNQEGNNRTMVYNGHGRHKTRTVKHKAPRDEVVLLERRLDKDKHSLNKPAGHDAKMHLAVVPCDLDCVGAVQQQRSGSMGDPEELSDVISNRSNGESGSVSSLVFELPLQILPPQRKVADHGRRRSAKPVKTLQLNSTLYDVELSVLGSSNTGRRVPLVSLMSKWNRRPVVGYPVSVEVCDDVFRRPVSSSSADGMLKRDEAQGLQCLVPSSYTWQEKPKSRRKTSEKEADKLWKPHSKKPASSSSRKMRRLSSFGLGQRDGGGRKSAVGRVSGPTIACIPLRVVFSRINEALSFPVK